MGRGSWIAMSPLVLHLLDYLLTAFHTAFMLFNILGWLPRRTRRWNLATLSLTALSWLGLGYWFGWGYCILTDWHWQIRRALGHFNMPNSYVKFLLDRLTGLDWNAVFVDVLTASVFAASLVLSVVLNIRDMRRERKASS